MNNSRPQLFGMLAGLFLAVGLVLSSMLGTTAWVKIKNSQFITSKGSTRKNVKSDLVVWKGSFMTEAPTLREAQRKLKADATKVGQFMNGSSVTNFVFTPINIEEVKASLKGTDGWVQLRTTGYRLSQSVRVES